MKETPSQFDFTSLGKQMPYLVPDGFFEQSEQQLKSTAQSLSANSKTLRRRWYAIAAGVAVLLAIYPVSRILQHHTDSETPVYCQTNNTSEDWKDFADADIFMENMDW